MKTSLSYLPPLFITISVMFAAPFLFENIYGHGLGADQAPPVSFAGMDVTVSTTLEPSDITVGDVDSANIGIRFFDTITDKNLKSVTYRVEVWRDGDLLARNLFFDPDGTLNVEVRPKENCTEQQLWKCSEYFGTPDPISGGLTELGGGRPLIKGPIFDKGGLYNIKVDIEGATSPKTAVAKVLSFETFVSVAQEQKFVIPTAEAEVPVTVKTYYDDVEDFKFDPSDNSISFDMPFNWEPSYIELVQVVHEELQVPKTFEPYSEGKQFKGFVDGVEVDKRVLLIDPYSFEDKNIIHFLVTGTELQRINDELGPEHYDRKQMSFDLIPQTEIKKNSLEIQIDSGATSVISWEGKYGAGDEIPFELTFFDENNNLLKDVRYGYGVNDQDGNELFSNIGNDPDNPGILASEGIDVQRITIPSQDIYQFQIAIFGQGIDYDQTYAGIGTGILEIGPAGTKSSGEKQSQISIPDWVRNNAGWWSEGQISDNDFASGIEFMIKEGIIKVPTTSSAQVTDAVIPDWVRNNAGWWAEGEISDQDFANGIQHLIKNGIISV